MQGFSRHIVGDHGRGANRPLDINAHARKSGAAYVGAERLSELCRRLESASAALPIEELPPLLAQVLREQDRAALRLRGIHEQPG